MEPNQKKMGGGGGGGGGGRAREEGGGGGGGGGGSLSKDLKFPGLKIISPLPYNKIGFQKGKEM